MAIVRIDPADWEHANVVQLDSDARDNMSARREIDDWAAERDFVQVNEYTLRVILSQQGRRVFRGICYRLTREERASAETASRNVAEALSRMPVTPHVR